VRSGLIFLLWLVGLPCLAEELDPWQLGCQALAAMQAEDGSFPARGLPGGHFVSQVDQGNETVLATATALLALSTDPATYGETLERGATWLIAQADENGRFGAIGWTQPVAVWALARIKPHAARAGGQWICQKQMRHPGRKQWAIGWPAIVSDPTRMDMKATCLNTLALAALPPTPHQLAALGSTVNGIALYRRSGGDLNIVRYFHPLTDGWAALTRQPRN